MINMKSIEKTIVNALQDHLKCPVIMANQVSPVPKYPYVSYTIITPLVSDDKTWNRTENGKQFKPLKQIWSFTVQSDDDYESMNLALKAYEWFSCISNIYLSAKSIVVQSVGNITKRDNLITTMYEYRNGFDVTFLLINMIETSVYSTSGIIETAELHHETN